MVIMVTIEYLGECIANLSQNAQNALLLKCCPSLSFMAGFLGFIDLGAQESGVSC